MSTKLKLLLTFTVLLGTLFCGNAVGAPKIHTVGFGKWMTVRWMPGTGPDDKVENLRIRALLVDGRVKEYAEGSIHEVTDRQFVLRRVFRVNDSMPDEMNPRWQWQRGGWLLVDRMTGRTSAINLPEYDPLYSAVSWYRDYVAYCGVSDDGKKTYAVVAQLSRRKPVLKKILGEGIPDDAGPNSACPAPEWQRTPVRVSFAAGSAKQTFAIRGHVVDVVSDAPEEED